MKSGRNIKGYGIKCQSSAFCKNEAKHLHHKDGNHSNNDKSNHIYLCVSCHAKSHNWERETRTFDTCDVIGNNHYADRLEWGFNMTNPDIV